MSNAHEKTHVWRLKGRVISLIELLKIVLVLLVFMRTAHAQTNASFETPYNAVSSSSPALVSGSIANGWFNNALGGTIVYGQETTIKHSGTSAQRVVLSSTPSWQFNQGVAVTAGHTYTASIWVRGTGISNVNFYLRKSGAPYTTYALTSVAPTPTWQQISFVYVAPTTETAWLMLSANTAGTLYFDDASFQDVTANIGQTYFTRPSDDSYVKEDTPTTAYGTSQFLFTKELTTPFDSMSYFKFPLSGVSGTPITSSQVWLYGANKGTTYSAGDSMYSVANTSWTENSLTWNIKPTLTTPALSTRTIKPKIGLYSDYNAWDVTSFVSSQIASSQTAASFGLKMDATSSTGLDNEYSPDERTTYEGIPGLMTMHANTPSYDPIPKSMFGMHTHNVTGHWPLTTTGTLRLWDTSTQWPNIEPNAPVSGLHTYNWTQMDAYVAKANAEGAEIVLCLGLTPKWAIGAANLAGSESAYGDIYRTKRPDDMANWTAYVSAVANRYKSGSSYGRIKYFEVWNEANTTPFYNSSISDLVLLTSTARTQVKAADSSNMIVSPDFVGSSKGIYLGPNSLNDFLTAGGGSYVDILAFHFYVDPRRPEEMAVLAASIRSLAQSHGLGNIPIWNTEFGYFKLPTDVTDGYHYVARSYLVACATGVARSFWYAWDQNSTEQVQLANSTFTALTNSGRAYNYVADWLIGAQLVYRGIDNNGTWRMDITRNGGYSAHILWNPNNFQGYTVPAAWGATRMRDLGNTLTTVPASFSVGPYPVILENQAPL